MAPPGRPKATSTPSISRLLMRACAPVSFMRTPASGYEKASRQGGRKSARDGWSVRLRKYDDGGGVSHRRRSLTHPGELCTEAVALAAAFVHSSAGAGARDWAASGFGDGPAVGAGDQLGVLGQHAGG